MCLLVFAILLTIAGAQDIQLEGPQNTLNVVGSITTLKCSSPSRNCIDTEWLKYGGSPSTVFNDRGILSSAYRDRYSVDNSSGCDLVIKNVQLTDAGRFSCRVFISSNTVDRTAYLIIQETQPNCTTTTSWNETVVGDDVLLNCMVTYNGTNRASMVWKGVEGAPAVVENGKSISHSLYVVASAPEVPSFTCITLFSTNDNWIKGLATNTLNTSCTTSAIKVLSNEQFQVEGPRNTLSVVGSKTELKCSTSSRNCSKIEWLKQSARNRTIVYKDSQGVFSAYRDRYSVGGLLGCDLVIKNVELTDAGRFICKAFFSTRIIEKTAHLQILETQPKCTAISSWHELTAGDDVRLSCMVTYNGMDTASMAWKGVEDAPETVRNGKTISWFYSIVASAPEIPSFTCIVTFAVDTRDSSGELIKGLARNVLNTTCATSVIKVLSVQQFRMEEPQNILSVVGSTVTWKCLSTSGNASRIQWLKYSAGNILPVFNDRMGIYGAYTDRYSVGSSSGYVLVIRNVRLTDAGRFICSIQTPTRVIEKTAYLQILEAEPECTIYASLNDTVEEDGVQLNCILAYNDGVTTKTVWSGVEDAPAAVRNGKTLIWSYYVAALAPDVPSFTCITSCVVETKDNNGAPIKGLATNIPNVTCTTSAIKVLYSVRDVHLSPSFSNYTTESRITCMAKGHPSPALKWQKLEDDGTWIDIQNQNSCELPMTNISSKRYRCIAMNVVRGRSYSAISHEFLLNNTGSDHNDSSTDKTANLPRLTMASHPLALIISVAVGAALGFLLITLPANCFLVRACPGYKCCHSGSKSKDKIRKEQPLTEVPDISNYANRVQDAHPSAKPKSVPSGEPSNRPQVATPQGMMSQTDSRKTGRAKPDPHVHKGRKDTEALHEHKGL